MWTGSTWLSQWRQSSWSLPFWPPSWLACISSRKLTHIKSRYASPSTLKLFVLALPQPSYKFWAKLHTHIAHTQAIADYNLVGSLHIMCSCDQVFTMFDDLLFQDSMRLNSNTIQETILDPGRNIIQYHVTNPEVDAMIVEDFNKVCHLIGTISSTRLRSTLVIKLEAFLFMRWQNTCIWKKKLCRHDDNDDMTIGRCPWRFDVDNDGDNVVDRYGANWCQCERGSLLDDITYTAGKDYNDDERYNDDDEYTMTKWRQRCM